MGFDSCIPQCGQDTLTLTLPLTGITHQELVRNLIFVGHWKRFGLLRNADPVNLGEAVVLVAIELEGTMDGFVNERHVIGPYDPRPVLHDSDVAGLTAYHTPQFLSEPLLQDLRLGYA